MRCFGGAIFILTSALLGVNAQDKTSAEQFVRQLYAPYASGSNGPDNLQKPEAIYDPELLALILRDRTMMQEHEKGLIRVDPICVCQDWNALRVLKVTVQPKSASQVDAGASFTDFGHRNSVQYQLTSAEGQWRVHDILGGVAPSLRQFLITGLAREEREIKAGR